MSGNIWHCKTCECTLSELGSSVNGLSQQEAARRLSEYGPNELREKKQRTRLAIFIDQFRDFMILVLLAAAVVSGILGEVADTAAIVAIIVLNAVIGFVQEFRAEEAMKALKQMAAPSAVVRRGGQTLTVAANELVPGDIVVLDAGRIVPADLRIVQTANLRIEEAALTGESVPVEKQTCGIDEEGLPLGDRKNMAYKGTFVTYGRGEGVVTATGMQTELGKIAAMLQGEEEGRTPLQRRLASFGRRLAYAVIAICVIVFAAGMLRGEDPVRMLLTAISLAVAAIPEALPAVVTISLALGARKMVALNALIRKLPAVETLGSVTYICSDKTGTLTMNRMTVEEVHVDNRTASAAEFPLPVPAGAPEQGIFLPDALFLLCLSLNNDSTPDENGNLLGDPTETALYEFSRLRGFERSVIEKDFPRAAEIPFDSERKLMTTFHRLRGAVRPAGMEDAVYISVTKGAVEQIEERSSFRYTGQGPAAVDRVELHRTSDRMAADGLRILGIGVRAWKELPAALEPQDVESGLTLVGLVGLLDPPREEAKDAVALCRSAGIRPVMITGDHPLTARAIARRIGILREEEHGVITGRELETMSLEEFEERVEKIAVYARVAPEQKLKIVRALQDKGHFVAMTGDGVNDAPALKRADMGVAMGITGTDVSKEASHMILLDDNFSTIVRAVQEGRKIYDNIRKFVKYLLTTNSGEIWTLFLAPFLGLPIPLLPIHILWINLVTDGLPALALSAEPAEGDLMKRPPRRPEESIFSHGLGSHAVWVGLLMAGVTLSLQAWSISTGTTHWQTMVFTVLCLTQLGHVLAIRSERQSLFSQGVFSNPWVIGAVVLTFLLQMATIYVPFLNRVFRTEPLSAAELLITVVCSSIVFCAVEIEKFVRRRTE
ncbi:MAG: cation-translocating P-type ATPase [Thermodesulfovibrionales bacterium]